MKTRTLLILLCVGLVIVALQLFGIEVLTAQQIERWPSWAKTLLGICALLIIVLGFFLDLRRGWKESKEKTERDEKA